jgi:LysR family transcriptional regulator, hydrogen peroxide-inducible genes activator
MISMPSLRQLQYFIAVSEMGHFRLAAEKVGVSQPTLSAQLAALEQRLGVALVERNRSPVVPTLAGARIMPLAKTVSALVQDIHDMARSHRSGQAGILRLGLPASIGPYLLPRILPALHKAMPELRLAVREDFPLVLPEALQAGVHDLVMLPLPVRAGDVATQRLFREPLYLAVPDGHPLAQSDEVDAAHLKGQPVFTLEKGHALHDQVHAICREWGANLQQDFEGTSLSTLHQMVIMGAGLTFLPGLYAKGALTGAPSIKLVTLKSKPLYRTIGLAWRTSSQDQAMFACLGQHVRDAVRRDFPDFLVHAE